MPTNPRPRRRLAAFLATLTVAGALAGCLSEAKQGDWVAEAPGEASLGAASTTGWQVGNWWAYKATFENGKSIDIALVVFEANDDGFAVGSNLSAGFFGLPFNGNITRPHLNPIIGGEEWRLYDFPLEGGKSWTYPLFGYDLTASVVAEPVEAPRVGEHPGFVLEAKSFGQVVARYTYSPAAEWFTRLVIYEPTDGHEVVRVELTDFGESYLQDYYVTVPVHAFETTYPSLPEDGRFAVEGSFLKMHASYVLAGSLGDFRFALKDPHGRTAVRGEVRPTGVLLDRQEIEPQPGRWTVDHVGLGDGSLHLDVTGVRPARQGRLVPMSEVPQAARSALDVDVPPIRLDLGPWENQGPAPVDVPAPRL